jgi:hypothetical protein
MSISPLPFPLNPSNAGELAADLAVPNQPVSLELCVQSLGLTAIQRHLFLFGNLGLSQAATKGIEA